jgi:DNA (cytosine-5)-methyltransferase 1
VQLPTPAFTIDSVPVLSFFTGAGFLDIGFIEAGFDTVWHNEYDANFVRGFEYGMRSLFGEGHPIVENTQSIVDLTGEQVLREAFDGVLPDVFGVIGGPPCPDFSVGGKNRGETGDRGQLSSVYVDRILEIVPTFFLMENVPGLARTAKHRDFLDRLMARLEPKYVVDKAVLNALEHGAPQDRERLFLVGFSKAWLNSCGPNALAAVKPFPWPIDRRYEGAKTRFAWPTTNPFGTTPEKPADVPEELAVAPYICDLVETAPLPNGREGFLPRSSRLSEVNEGDTSRKSFKRLHRWRYSPTVAYGNNEVHLHPTQPRRLTVREALRLQTVPDAYALPPDMPLSHKFKTIGNGVPVRLGSAMASAIRQVLASCTASSSDAGAA